MKLIIAVIFCLLIFGSTPFVLGDDGRQPGFAIVELFTSEGCSSCPPADAVLSKIVTDARKNGSPVYAMAFHVDYWNRLGWVDRFSSPTFSQRQQAYSEAMNRDQTYTPQMILNGSVEFLGSDSERAKDEIKSALQIQPAAKLKIEFASDRDGVKIKYEVTPATPGSMLNFALVERGLHTKESGGENEGRLLQHDNVVRLFKTIEVEPSGFIAIKIPAGTNPTNASLIAFVQDVKSMKITAATAMDLPDH